MRPIQIRLRWVVLMVLLLHQAPMSYAQAPYAVELPAPVITALQFKEERDTLNLGLVRVYDVTIQYDYSLVPESCRRATWSDHGAVGMVQINDDDGDFEYIETPAGGGETYLKVYPDGNVANTSYGIYYPHYLDFDPMEVSHRLEFGVSRLGNRGMEYWPTHMYFYIDFILAGVANFGGSTTCWSRVGNVVPLAQPVPSLPPLGAIMLAGALMAAARRAAELARAVTLT